MLFCWNVNVCININHKTVTLSNVPRGLSMCFQLALKSIGKYKWVLQCSIAWCCPQPVEIRIVEWGEIFTDFLLATSLSTLKIWQRDFEGCEFAKVYDCCLPPSSDHRYRYKRKAKKNKCHSRILSSSGLARCLTCRNTIQYSVVSRG